MTTILTGALALVPSKALSEDGFVSLTDEEMKARVARKEELQRMRSSGKTVSALDIRSDVNPGDRLRLYQEERM